MNDGEEKLLTPTDAAIFLGVTIELIFQFTKESFAKSSGLRSLQTEELKGKTWFRESELTAFDHLLSGHWCGPNEPRPSIPKAILDHLRSESHNQCARCGSGSGVDTAHIIPWAKSRSHHPNNLIRICSACHREHDSHQSLSSFELDKLKQSLIEQTRYRLSKQTNKHSERLRPPRCAQNFFGREGVLQDLLGAIQLGDSVIISGVGGIGKTELLLQALRLSEIDRTVLWINVEQYQNISELTTALRSALSDGGSACDEGELLLRLDDIRACVVLDSIEQNSLGNLDDFEDAISGLLDGTYDTQFLLTSQVKLYRFPANRFIELEKLEKSASRSLLQKSFLGYNEDNDNALNELLMFCDGHPLAIQFAGALSNYYGSSAKAMAAIERSAGKSFCYPGRQRHDRKTSLELCLNTAYTTLSLDCKKLLWSLALSPAGLFKEYFESNWSQAENPIESLSILRRWHFLTVTPINEKLSRTNLLEPIRQFVISKATLTEKAEFEEIVRCMVNDFGMMVAVLELYYDSPEDTSHVMQRYEAELPNLLATLKLAKERKSDQELVKTAVSIASSLMRYFFVSRLPEQGTKVMLDAATLALRSSNIASASILAMQFMTLATRSLDDSLVTKGIELVDQIELSVDPPQDIPELAMARAIVAQKLEDFLSSEKYARQAIDVYQSRLSSATNTNKPEECDDLHNNIANAVGVLGYSLLSQGKYQEARDAYRHSLSHEKGTSIGVNRGQTLHQLGNCEAYLENFNSAAHYYFKAAKVFHFVKMDEYLSNAFGELGYVFLDTHIPEILEKLSEDLVESALLDIKNDILRALDLDNSINHQFCVGIIRKLFGTIILVSLTNYGEKLGLFCADLANSTMSELKSQIIHGTRDQDDIFPIMTIDMIFYIGGLIAQAEKDVQDNGDINRETTGKLLGIICEAHDWTLKVLRLSDWFAVYLARQWDFKEISPTRLREFVENYRNGIEDSIDLGAREW